jgi:cytochrome c553
LPEISQTAADDAVSPSAQPRQSPKVAARSLLATLIAGLVAVLPAAAQTIKERVSACFGCHGENGQSLNPDIPSLGATTGLLRYSATRDIPGVLTRLCADE